MKTTRRAALLLLLLPAVLSGALACKKPRGGPADRGNAVPVKVMDLPAQIQATGTVTPRVGAQVKVGPRVSGRLEHLYVQVGDRVRKGQVLAVLEQKDLKATVARSEAALLAAQAAVRYAEANYRRLEELLPKGFVSQDAVDAAKRTWESARADVKSASAQLDYAKVQLSYATVTSPIDGVVGSVSTQEGETVAASLAAPTFVTIIDLSRLEVDAFVDEVDIGGVKVGQKATFTVDAFPDKVFAAEVEAIYPQAVIQDNVVNYTVILKILDPFEGLLRPQMTASVTITLDTVKGVLVVPSRAVRRQDGKTVVMVPGPKGPVPRPVTLGRDFGDVVQVKAGLSEGDRVLVTAPRGEATP